MSRPCTPLLDRFVLRVDMSKGQDSCWPWKGPCFKSGYGAIGAGGDKGKVLYTHRVAYELWVSAIPSGLNVLHHCDNPPCCNPSHLFLGDHQDNSRDMTAKARGNSSKLLVGREAVLEQLVASGMTKVAAATAMGIPAHVVYDYLSRGVRRRLLASK